MNSAPLLLICRTPAQWAAGHRTWPRGRRVVVASDDPRVHELARRDPAVVETVYAEPLSSFYTVAPAVRAIVERLDRYSAACAPDLAEALRWGCTVEGGMTSQRVQDALLLIDACHDLLDRTAPGEIVVCSGGADSFADTILAAVARHRGIPFRCETPARSRLIDACRRGCRPWLLLAYRLAHFFRRWTQPRDGSIASQAEGSFVFVLCSHAGNHWDNIRPVAQDLTRRGARCIAITWTASERITPAPVDATLVKHPLEPWTGVADVIRCLAQSARLSFQLRRALAEHADEFIYRDIALAPLLQASLRHFAVADLPLRLLFRCALAKALGATQPRAVKPWGAPEGFEYRQIAQLWPRQTGPLLFQYWLGVGMAWPYADPHQPLDLFLAKNRDEAAQFCADYRRPALHTAVIGPIRLAGHRQFADETTPRQSRSALGLADAPGALWVGFDPNCALRGYQSAREQVAITESLLAALRAAPLLHLVVKPHPAYPIDHLLPLFQDAPTRIVLLPARAPLNHFLNAIDLLVSKYSTLLLEAALMRRIAVPIIPGGDARFRVFGDLAPLVSDLSVLTTLLTQLASNPEQRDAWHATRLAEQERYLAENGYLAARDLPAARAAAVLLERTAR